MYMQAHTFVGRMAADPTIFTKNPERPVAKFTIMVNSVWYEGGEKRERSDRHPCTAFGVHAKNIEKFGYRGKVFGVHADLRNDGYKDETGKWVDRWSFKVNKLFFGPDTAERRASLAETKSASTGVPIEIPMDLSKATLPQLKELHERLRLRHAELSAPQ